MSFDSIEQSVKAHMPNASSSARGKSIHESAAQELLRNHVTEEKDLGDGRVEQTQRLEIRARTRLPSPAASAGLLHWSKGYDYFFGSSAQVRNETALDDLNNDYMELMVSKDGQGRKEYVMVAGASAMNPQIKTENQLEQLNTQ